MDAGVGVELGVEGDGELASLAGGHDVAVDGGERLGVLAYADDARGADEGHGDVAKALKACLRVEAAELAAVGVALDLDVHGGQARGSLVVVGRQALGEQDETGTGGENRHAACYALAKALEYAELGEKLALRGGFPARQDEALKRLLKVFCLAQLHVLFAKLGQAPLVLCERPLYRKYRSGHVCLLHTDGPRLLTGPNGLMCLMQGGAPTQELLECP